MYFLILRYQTGLRVAAVEDRTIGEIYVKP